MNEPAIDLGIVLALISSYKDKPIDEKTICFGEVGLSGEVRAVNMAEQRGCRRQKNLALRSVFYRRSAENP